MSSTICIFHIQKVVLDDTSSIWGLSSLGQAFKILRADSCTSYAFV